MNPRQRIAVLVKIPGRAPFRATVNGRNEWRVEYDVEESPGEKWRDTEQERWLSHVVDVESEHVLNWHPSAQEYLVDMLLRRYPRSQVLTRIKRASTRDRGGLDRIY